MIEAPKLDPQVLGQLTVMQSLLVTLPDESTIFGFICRGLRDIPGVAEVGYQEQARAEMGEGAVRVPLRMGSTDWGSLLVQVRDEAAFLPYEFFLNNFCLMVVLILEERRQRRLNEANTSLLEQRVQERSSQLIAEITGRKWAESSLELARFTLDHMADPIFWIRPDGTFLDINQAACDFMGYPREELLALRVQDVDAFYHAELWQAHWEDLRVAGTLTFPSRHVRKDGLQVDVEICANYILWGDQELNCAISRDISERVRAQAQMLRLNEELEGRVQERTAALEAANHELESFSYSVSHDLRSPLRGIDGFSQVLLEDYGDRLDAEGVRTIARIRQGTQRMGALIDDLLSLSRMSRTALNPRSLDLSALASTVVEDLEQGEPLRKVEVRIEAGLLVEADPGLLRQVLENLLGNAWKFTAKAAQARIEVCRETLPDGQSVFCVRDNGAGFDMAYVQKLFIPFQRLHGAHEFEGTGIGLAIVQRIIQRHGGRVWAQGAKGQGACFRFTLAGPASSSEV